MRMMNNKCNNLIHIFNVREFCFDARNIFEKFARKFKKFAFKRILFKYHENVI